MDAGGASANLTWPLSVANPMANLLSVNGGLRWPPLLLLHSSRRTAKQIEHA